jgi:hypothetical protein
MIQHETSQGLRRNHNQKRIHSKLHCHSMVDRSSRNRRPETDQPDTDERKAVTDFSRFKNLVQPSLYTLCNFYGRILAKSGGTYAAIFRSVILTGNCHDQSHCNQCDHKKSPLSHHFDVRFSNWQ